MHKKITSTINARREMSVHQIIAALPDCQPCLERMIDHGALRVTGALRLRVK